MLVLIKYSEKKLLSKIGQCIMQGQGRKNCFKILLRNQLFLKIFFFFYDKTVDKPEHYCHLIDSSINDELQRWNWCSCSKKYSVMYVCPHFRAEDWFLFSSRLDETVFNQLFQTYTNFESSKRYVCQIQQQRDTTWWKFRVFQEVQLYKVSPRSLISTLYISMLSSWLQTTVVP